jgi:hypothetical protein
VNALNFWRTGYVRIDQLLKSRSLVAIEAKAHRSYLGQPMNNWLEAGGFGVERHKGDIGEPWLGVMHDSPHPNILGLCHSR